MASFEIDRQTIADLGIFSDEGVSVFSFFDNVKTIGGRQKLKELMGTPSCEIDVLTSRRDSIKFFYNKGLTLDVNKNTLDFIEHYLAYGRAPLRANIFDAVFKGITYQLSPNKDYYTILQGITDSRKVLKSLYSFYNSLSAEQNIPPSINVILAVLSNFFAKPEIQKIIHSAEGELGYIKTSHYDNLFRNTEREALKDIINLIYELDGYIAIAQAVDAHGLCFPEYTASNNSSIKINGLHHPCISNAVINDVLIAEQKNVCFLTGANMAGKSSYLKALGLAVYLAHIGFPVPAAQMQTTVFNGLISTINLPDNIGSGYSHYFSEVKRLKKVAETVSTRDKLLVIFDELFRGTNVKDAYDASLATILALAKIKSSIFLISTHIVEIAEELKKVENISFQFFGSKIENGKPAFDFKIREGVSSETLGYFIFKREGIIELFEKAALKKESGEG